MASQVWFGTENRMSWIPAPAANPGVSRNLAKWRGSQQYLNGGQWRRESATGSRQVQMTWPVMTGANVRKITTYLEGTYGPGPFYYSDPFAESANVLPQWLAAPYLACNDGPRLYGINPPIQVNTAANIYGHPSFGAQYQFLGAVTGTLFSFPVPPNTVVNFGWKGAVTGAALLKALGGTTITAPTTTVTPTAVTSATLTSYTFTAAATGGWLNIQLSATGAGTLTAYSMHLGFGAAPTGDFIKGEGFSALSLDGDPSITGYSSGGLDRQAVSANFVETGAWA